MIFSKKIDENIVKDSNKIIFIDYYKKWTWRDVSEKANKFIKIIKPHIEKNQISVPILISRRAELLVAFIACLKLNISFTPILHISEKDTFSITNKLNSKFYFNPVESKVITNEKFVNKFRRAIKIKNKIYILFTSGSTGKPKGVICDKINIMNTLMWSTNYINWKKNDVIGNVTKFNFDISLFDFFSSIYFNIPLSIIKNPNDIDLSLSNIKKNKITSIFSTPSFFSQFVYSDYVKKTNKTSLKQILSGGDFFPNTHLSNWLENNNKLKIYNVWGPTETSIVNSMYIVKKSDRKRLSKQKYLPVGQSTKRMEISIIKNRKIMKKSNEEGFICLSGKSICKGFIDENHRYKKMLTKIGNKTFFNTGDLGYFDKFNYLHIIGRKDNTIKIQGYRINQKEVEQLSETYNNVFLTATFKKNINEVFSELQILVQLKKNINFDIFKFKSFLRKKLPFYKIPKKIIIIKKIPMNANGKIDRIAINNSYN